MTTNIRGFDNGVVDAGSSFVDNSVAVNCHNTVATSGESSPAPTPDPTMSHLSDITVRTATQSTLNCPRQLTNMKLGFCSVYRRSSCSSRRESRPCKPAVNLDSIARLCRRMDPGSRSYLLCIGHHNRNKHQYRRGRDPADRCNLSGCSQHRRKD